MRAAIPVAHAKVALADHVKVEIGKDPVGLPSLEGRAVVLGPKEAVFFSTPPREADLVLGPILAHSEEELQ
jgi:hypothetical protein